MAAQEKKPAHLRRHRPTAPIRLTVWLDRS
jgi:hypothetical protein